MKVILTDFQGLLLIEPKTLCDNRGSFYESWREADYKQCGIQETFIQDNISISKKNVLRGLHYQKNQGQLVTVSYGQVFDVVVDIRPTSLTYGKYFSIELSGDNPKQLYMPPGFAHGFCVLSDVAIINYKCTQYHNAQEEGGVIWNDSSIRVEWPVESPIISQKDQGLGSLESIR
ncbi:MAG: dTDP-4-dehydrorhamnose 3,5-epimerase [Candidatus Paracaedibacter sp.]